MEFNYQFEESTTEYQIGKIEKEMRLLDERVEICQFFNAGQDFIEPLIKKKKQLCNQKSRLHLTKDNRNK